DQSCRLKVPSSKDVQECFYCHKQGHLIVDCNALKRKQTPQPKSVGLLNATLFTVFLNLLVTVSISHFKQLHTPTNVLILSLAVADLIAGLILMPVQGMKLIEPCWYFGEIFCSIFPLILYVVGTASLGNLVIISVDRYIAVNDPLNHSCIGESTDKKARSEKKAARTLGIVVLVYLLCWTPYYLATLSFGHDENDALVINIMQWIVCMNSLMNPFIYAMFYRWFRLSAKYILTLKILEPSSEYFSLFPEEK
uniref:Uncharacterized protein n=1 Tax=Cyprinus carpio TaxID=7962 RepID=A0A8C2KLE9_CYPCA